MPPARAKKTVALFCLLFIVAVAGVAFANAGKPFDFIAVNQENSPIVILDGAGVVRDSDVGNQDFYAESCYLAKNTSHKSVNAVRYELTYFSLFKEHLGTIYKTEIRHIEPYSEDHRPQAGRPTPDPTLVDWSECLQKVNSWDTIGRVEFAVDAVMFTDGTIWRAKDHPSKISKVNMTPPIASPTPEASSTPQRRARPATLTPEDVKLFGADYTISCEDVIVGPLFPDASSLNERDARLASDPALQARVKLCEDWREANPAPPTPQPRPFRPALASPERIGNMLGR